ncbi:MAG: type V CRISPR-associated protein Cas12a/Cpf1 [Phocaeicola sp.]|nr:type V CRISPR-associated protein Cas12a/Cpf1 [Phocaeicola sp.]MDD7448101.1 type V CRISPR-associated protein Cas12a/Cpf1 [Prevotellaceae bacterium]MDY3913779.1 type V CRISPR-associated protein Cas12a/Cpf1 [Phocaeicola sp.]MDY5939551.1 type V CRISPR-associated protein Cas12a/Cpf1 [Phocaeicola sp.]
MNKLNSFTHLYPVSKTLRFELRPIGKTIENVTSYLQEDKKRANNYRDAKKLIDNYHKHFIDSTLESLPGSTLGKEIRELIEKYYECYRNKEKQEEIEKLQEQLRKKLVSAFTQHENYKNNFDKELFKSILPTFVETEEEQLLLKEFNNFTTYFTGFHENRRNIYSNEAKSTAIGYRAIHENLPKFIGNILIFQELKEPLQKEIGNIRSAFKSQDYLKTSEIEEFFSPAYYLHTLSSKGIALYNALIGKIVLKDGTELKGLNEAINLYNQQHKEKRLPLLKPLYKQILSDREQLSWLPETFEEDQELIKAVQGFYTENIKDLLPHIQTLLKSICEYDLDRIYLPNDTQLTDISQKVFGNWSKIQSAREEHYRKYIKPIADEKINKKYEEKRDKVLKKERSCSIAHLQACIAEQEKEKNTESRIVNYFMTVGQKERDTSNLIDNIYATYKDFCSIRTEKKLGQDTEAIARIKAFLDSINELLWFIKPLLGAGNETDRDEHFYGELNYIWDTLKEIIPLYNKVRGYLTQKPYSIEKIKLNFGNSTLLNGWDRNKEKDYNGIILRKGGNYYLAIMNKKYNKSFKKEPLPTEGACYEKMEYKQLPNPYANLPKDLITSEKGKTTYQPSQEVLDIYNNKTFKKDNKVKEGKLFNKQDLYKLIDFFKESIGKHPDWKHFNFQFSDTSTYDTIADFYTEVSNQGYKITFRNVSEAYINQLVDEGKLYLFQIYNKDFSTYSKGTPNLHTLYWKMLFHEKNLQDVVYKLSGGAEMFYREKSITTDKPTHPANLPIKRKRSEGKDCMFTYDLIKDKRYTVDKFQFHVPITMNFKSANDTKLNDKVCELIKEEKDLHIMGIDRGERHLIYVCIIDSKGNIVLQESLNCISSEKQETNYQKILDEREQKRDEERRNWQSIEGIKDLKEGYLSQVVHKISQWIIEHNAIVVLEDLNMGFKRSRQKIEKSVYQKFEKQLTDKLNYLVFKKKEIEEAGGVLHAYQLTYPMQSMTNKGKQNGFLFYIPAWNTSKIDPTTGFVNLFNTRYEGRDKTQKFFNKFGSISYNKEKGYFEFAFDYSPDFTTKAEGTRTQWTVATYGSRIETFQNKNNQWDYRNVNLTEEMAALLSKKGIAYEHGENLKDAIVNINEKEFFEELLRILRLTLQMRNSRKDTNEDYILSPVANDQGEFYDSRLAGDSLPKDADANGAYHIALKGLWNIRHIREKEDTAKLPSLTNKDWLKFVQEKPYKND